jgi:hypothetical protein
MVIRTTPWPPGTPCWIDVSADDVGSARLFYEQLFGWQIPEGRPEFGGYSTCTKDGHGVAGLSPKMSADQPSVWTTYLATDDIDATFTAVTEHGGQVISPPMDVMDLGKMAIVVDPGGAVFGLWQAGTHTGVNLANEPGSLIWEENMSRDWEANKAFYSAVYGYTYADMSGDGFQYATLSPAGSQPGPQTSIGGIGAKADDDSSPACWSIYFAVDDTDESVDEVVKLGGSLLRPAWDTPYGRMAMVADPEGAAFALMSVAPRDGDS